MSVIEGDTGVIVIDPLISEETAAAAFALDHGDGRCDDTGRHQHARIA